MAVIEYKGEELNIDASLLPGFQFQTGSLYEFIGEIEVSPWGGTDSRPGGCRPSTHLVCLRRGKLSRGFDFVQCSALLHLPWICKPRTKWAVSLSAGAYPCSYPQVVIFR